MFVDDDRPAVVRLTGRRRTGSTGAVVILGLLLVAVSIWKPWGANPGAIAGAPSIGPRATLGAQVALRTATPSATPAEVVAGPGHEILDGIDLAFMAASDPHPAFGVAAAYVPPANVSPAAASGAPSATPVVDWVSLRPDNAGPGPILDRPDSPTVALAATWPPGPPPRALTLRYLGPVLRPNGTSPSGTPARVISLVAPVPRLAQVVRFALPRSAGGPDTSDSFNVDAQSGTFFLPPARPPTDPGGWLTRGWPPGAYEFIVSQADGTMIRLQFVLGG